ncbi:ABC transporter substrate-binding protein [Salinispira pacifica]|uniref:Vitamin B12 ABC transporter, B12-binding component BtuF n=1 Tax=Salinispira pacifica TaxID=1307761 RepID=V5WM66_9SPIO|nr:ABC transporter substrate-binding protein [Salinispira pacifica]AHC16206.1 Vitamin B12 ABC transporter, B12-binding component BtuF [Salinispira pacifica]
MIFSMKRAVAGLLLALVLVFPLAAAGSGEQTAETPSAAAESAVPSESPSDSTPETADAIVRTSYPLTVKDGLNNEVTIQSEPESVASLTLFSDEVLMDLISTRRLAAITSLASDPVYSNVADRAEEVPRQIDLNVELLIEMYPDMVFVANWSDQSKVEQLEQAGLTVYRIQTPVTMNGIREEILKLGRILNAPEEARRIVDEMNRTLEDVSLALENLEPEEKLRTMDYNTWGSASGGDTTWNIILDHAGLINIAASYGSDDYGQVPVSKELLIAEQPDLLFLPGWVWGEPEAAEGFKDEVQSDPSLQDVPAVENRRLYMVPEHLKSTYSQYIADSVRFVAERAYPGLF